MIGQTQGPAIEALVQGDRSGARHQVLLGVTGSGKTFTVANVIQELKRPALILAPNKTLAAQLFDEFRALFPDNAVEYFVSFYDYYQPEAYIPSRDLYIEKDASINDRIDRMRHAATKSALTRRDTIVVASVSCIYGLGAPEEYESKMLILHPGQDIDQRDILRSLVDMQYERNDLNLVRAKFRVRGDTIEVHYLIREGEKERVQIFAGTVIALQGGGVRRTCTVRRIVAGEGVERTFPLHSPRVADIKVRNRGVIRRAKLYYLREREGKATRLKPNLGKLQAPRSGKGSGLAKKDEAPAAE